MNEDDFLLTEEDIEYIIERQQREKTPKAERKTISLHKTMRKQWKSGVAGVIAAAVMILFFMAIIYAFLNFGVTNVDTTIIAQFGTGIFDANNLNFVLQIWFFWLMIVLFATAVWVWQRAQQRTPNQDV